MSYFQGRLTFNITVLKNGVWLNAVVVLVYTFYFKGETK